MNQVRRSRRFGRTWLRLLPFVLLPLFYQNCSPGFQSVAKLTSEAGSSVDQPSNDGGTPPAPVDTTPPPVVAPKPQFASGFYASCRVLEGVVKCWGSGTYSLFTAGRTNLGTVLAPETLLTPNVTDLAMNSYDSECHIINGAVICSGGEWNPETLPPTFVTRTVIPSGATKVKITNRQGCALVGSDLRCWLLHSNMAPTTRIANVMVSDFSVAEGSVCAVVAGGAVVCVTFTPNATPVTMIASGATKVIVGRFGSACALVGRQLQCWSSGDMGFRLPDGTYSASTTPITIMDGVVDFAVERDYVQRMICVVKVDTSLSCFGETQIYQMTSDFDYRVPPATVTASDTTLIASGVRSVSMMSRHAIVVELTSGAVRSGMMTSTPTSSTTVFRDVAL